MASTWSSLGIRLMTTGENANAWGDQTNYNWERLEDAADGFATVAVTGATTLTFTTEPTSYADENGRNKVLQFTGTAGGTQAITFPNIEKTYHVLNDSNSILTLTTGTGAATVTLAAGKDKMIYNDGSDEIHDALANLSTTTLTTSGIVTAGGTSVFTNLDISGDIDVDGTTNLDIVDIDGAVNMATTALVTGVLTTTATTVFNGGFTANDGSTITTADTSNTLTLKSTSAGASAGPRMVFERDSATPADSDQLGLIMYFADNDAGESTNFFETKALIVDASDGSEDAEFRFSGMSGGSSVEYMRMSSGSTPTVTLNEGSADIDFRVESDSNSHMFFVDAGNNRISMGDESPSNCGAIVTVSSGDSGATVNGTFDAFCIEGGGTRGMSILTPNDQTGAIVFGDPDDNDIGKFQYSHAENSMTFVVNTAERMRINSSGYVGIGNNDPDAQLKVDTALSNYTIRSRNTHGSDPYGLFIKYTSAGPDNSSNNFLLCQDNSTTRLVIHSDGDAYNHDGVFAQISDERIKQNITDASSQWDDIKAIKVRNFERKDDVRAYGEGKKIQIGVIAQELEAVSPKLVKEVEPDFSDIISDSTFGTVYTADDLETQDAVEEVLYTADDQEVIDGDRNVGELKTEAKASTKQVNDIKSVTGEKVKGVKYSILYMKAIKALQEAMTRIETLETKVAALES